MPYSTPVFKTETLNHLKENFDSNSTILDVGAGAGFNYKSFGEFFPNMDAVEVFERYISHYGLNKKYRNVFLDNILTFEFEWYDIIIMGDVLEHIEESEAIDLVKKIYPKCKELIIAIPYDAVQGSWGGNDYEIHLQPTLTHESFMEKYEGFKPLAYRNDYGVYVKDTHRQSPHL